MNQANAAGWCHSTMMTTTTTASPIGWPWHGYGSPNRIDTDKLQNKDELRGS